MWLTLIRDRRKLMIFKRLILGVFLITGMLFNAADGSAAEKKAKVGFVYVGPIGDHGWSYPVSYTHLTLPTILLV